MDTSKRSQWIIRTRPNPQARLRLFCFPYAGGSAATYRRWPDIFPQSIEVCAVQLPGRGSRLHEPAFASAEALVPVLADALAPHLNGPVAFFGHSMGAIIAFELARYLRAERKRDLTHLFVSGRRAPQIKLDEAVTYDLPEPEFIEAIRDLNGTPKEVFEHTELLQLMIPLLRADFAFCQTYEYSPQPPFEFPITVLGGVEDDKVSPEHLEAWREQTTGSFSLEMLPGDHFFINAPPQKFFQSILQDLARFT